MEFFLYIWRSSLTFLSLPTRWQHCSAIFMMRQLSLYCFELRQMRLALSQANPRSSSRDFPLSQIFSQQFRESLCLPSSSQHSAISLQTSTRSPTPRSARLRAQKRVLMLSSCLPSNFCETPSLKAEQKSCSSASGALSFLSSRARWKYLEALSYMLSRRQMLPTLWQVLDRSMSSHPHWLQIFRACVQLRKLSWFLFSCKQMAPRLLLRIALCLQFSYAVSKLQYSMAFSQFFFRQQQLPKWKVMLATLLSLSPSTQSSLLQVSALAYSKSSFRILMAISQLPWAQFFLAFVSLLSLMKSKLSGDQDMFSFPQSLNLEPFLSPYPYSLQLSFLPSLSSPSSESTLLSLYNFLSSSRLSTLWGSPCLGLGPLLPSLRLTQRIMELRAGSFLQALIFLMISSRDSQQRLIFISISIIYYHFQNIYHQKCPGQFRVTSITQTRKGKQGRGGERSGQNIAGQFRQIISTSIQYQWEGRR